MKFPAEIHVMKSTVMKVLLTLLLFANAAFAADPLPSWNDGPTKQGIITFVEKVTLEGSPAFVPPAERIATFDNDGTLWCGQPVPVQLYFALDKMLAEPLESFTFSTARAAVHQLGQFGTAAKKLKEWDLKP